MSSNIKNSLIKSMIRIKVLKANELMNILFLRCTRKCISYVICNLELYLLFILFSRYLGITQCNELLEPLSYFNRTQFTMIEPSSHIADQRYLLKLIYCFYFQVRKPPHRYRKYNNRKSNWA